MSGSEYRLPDDEGCLINRKKPIRFTFEGQICEGFEGDTIASALLSHGRSLLSRSFKYHRPRGVLTMAGQDANTLVQVGNMPNVLADKYLITEGLHVTGQNYTGSLAKDKNEWLGSFGRFMPVGFYYRAFFKPFGAWEKWEKIIRAKAGLGKIGLDNDKRYYDKAYRFYDFVVVGSGPAGMSAALKAANAGASVLLVEEQRIIGGALSFNRFTCDETREITLQKQLVDQIKAHENITVLTESVCNGWFTDNFLPVIKGNRLYKVRAKACVLATGSFEQHVVFRHNDIPGVMLCSAALRLIKWYGINPGKKAVILTGNDEGYLTALTLLDKGIEVVAVVDMRKVDMREQPESDELLGELKRRHVQVYQGATVYEAMADKGRQALCSVDIRAIKREGEVALDSTILECDLLCMSSGFMPAYQLACQAGAKLTYDDEHHQFSLEGLPAHLYLAGSVNGIHDLSKVIADGERAATEALSALGLSSEKVTPVHCHKRMQFGWPIFPHPKGKDFVDFDEDLQSADLVNATKMGYRDIQLVKRFSTVGMGPSQGRHSALPTARLVAKATDRTVSETGVTTARPPFSAEKLAHLVGRNFEPYRCTPMHTRHLQLGASMIPAGNWQRPAFYGERRQRDQCIEQESVHVRTKVGMIDVSTLGGIEIFGADAAELMNRIYTFGFIKQPVGKTRYAVLTNEYGVIIDDGVACRISDEHFYVTATTSGVERVYREMLKWNAQWRLNVEIVNVTSAFAGVNLAGPDSRALLQPLVDIDLSSESFPYLAYREGKIGNIPARFLRVGFVGELGYEIHVPFCYALTLWDHLIEAGKDFDLKTFGVETQRLLRLEKGHIIVSQDTDSMTHPGEVHLGWAIGKKKPFFVGKRSVEIVMARKQTRKLVGFKIPLGKVKPKEGHLTFNGDEVSGNVTSCEYSPTIGAVIGMAYVRIDQASVGDSFHIGVGGSEKVTCTVVELPFYDAESKRQEM